MPPESMFLKPFGLKTDIDFDHHGLESGMVFKGTTRAYKRIENGMFWSKKGSGSKEPHREFREVLPPPTPSTYRAAPFQCLVNTRMLLMKP